MDGVAHRAPGIEATARRVRVTQDVSLAVRHWRRVDDPPGAAAVPFLLVHGLASNARMWDGVAADLAAQGHEAWAVDLRGHGRSDKPEAGYDFETLTDDLRALVEDVGLERPVVAGQSWGANLAVEFGHRFPSSTRGIACVDGGLIELSERFPDWEECARVLAPPRLAGAPRSEIERYARTAHPDWPESGIQGLLANFETRDDGTVAPWLTFERHMTILRGLWEHRPSERLATLDVPLLLIPAIAPGDAGSERRIALARAARLARRVRVRPFVGADHDIHAQHPDELAGVLLHAVTDGFFA
jgi:pimeloyl-ACP methyl ester carboxylesterase